jgi:hypothetical protein
VVVSRRSCYFSAPSARPWLQTCLLSPSLVLAICVRSSSFIPCHHAHIILLVPLPHLRGSLCALPGSMLAYPEPLGIGTSPPALDRSLQPGKNGTAVAVELCRAYGPRIEKRFMNQPTPHSCTGNPVGACGRRMETSPSAMSRIACSEGILHNRRSHACLMMEHIVMCFCVRVTTEHRQRLS